MTSIPPNDPFRGARLKIERAKQHISELNREIDVFRQRRPYALVVEGDSHPATFMALTIRVRENIPDPVPLVLGDAIHTLRSALDHVICDAVRRRGGTIFTETQFPFTKGENFEGAIQHRHIHEAGPEVVEVVRSLKPNKASNPALWMLHELDIEDKHKLLLPVASSAGIRDFRLSNALGNLVTMLNIRMGIRDGAVFIKCPPIANLKLGDEFNLSFEIEFPDGISPQRSPLVTKLMALTKSVEDVVNRIAATNT